MNARASLWASLAIAASIGLAGCGGSSNTKTNTETNPQPTSVSLSGLSIPDGMTPGDETINLAAGGSETRNGLTFSCTGEPCVIMIEDGTVMKTGGTVGVALSPAAVAANANKSIADQRRDDERKDDLASAKKLYEGISAPAGTNNGAIAEAERSADYDGNNIRVEVDIDSDPGSTSGSVVAELLEDKDENVDDNYGWTGKRYHRTKPAAEGMYEAHVYSYIGKPTEGAKFNSGTGAGNVGFALEDNDDDDTLTIPSSTDGADTGTNVASRIKSPSFDHTVGSKTFKLPDNDNTGATTVPISGSYFGVSGTYICTPADGECKVSRAEDGYVLGVGTWTFKADDPEAKVSSATPTVYASYGWWLHKSQNGETYTASAFAADKGAVPDATGITALKGTATYTGGSAGKYALSSSTGGTNDAGHFTAKATLSANFNTNKVEGTIDTFVGDDGESRDWSV